LIDKEITKKLLQGAWCDNCSKRFDCKEKDKLKIKCCTRWVRDLFVDLFGKVRRAYPTQVASDLVSVQPMKEPSGEIFYLKPTKAKRKNDRTT
jgi:hypothetical protein